MLHGEKISVDLCEASANLCVPFGPSLSKLRDKELLSNKLTNVKVNRAADHQEPARTTENCSISLTVESPEM